MSDQLVTVHLTIREARALTRAADWIILTLAPAADEQPRAMYTARGKLETAVALTEASA